MKKIFLSLLLCAGTVHAEFRDGNDLHRLLNSKDFIDQADALGYIVGVADALRGVIHCITPNVTAGQLMDMTQLHLRRHPETRHFAANYIVATVLRQTWPCPKKGEVL